MSNGPKFQDPSMNAFSPHVHSGDWLRAYPIRSCGLRVDNDIIRIAAALCSGCFLFHPHEFVLQSTSWLLWHPEFLLQTSLTSGLFPTSKKCASVTPALKKATLDPFDLGNYRPISNLTLVSKLLEHAAHEQIVEYASENQLLPDVQSAYQKHSNKLTLLGLLDLSAL